MNINGTTLIAIVTAPLIIGSLLGAPYQTRPNPKAAARPKPPDSTHSNYIRIEIRPGTKVAVVAPEVGDTVEWYPQATNANPNPLPATVRFQGKPPCAGHNTGDPISACKVTTRGNFEYDCVPPGTCVDPGMDPRSQTGTVLLAMPAPGGGGAPPPPPPPPVRAPAPALALANGPPDLPTMTISCDQTQTPIVPQGKNPLAAYQSQQISWVAGTVSTSSSTFPLSSAWKIQQEQDIYRQTTLPFAPSQPTQTQPSRRTIPCRAYAPVIRRETSRSTYQSGRRPNNQTNAIDRHYREHRTFD